jgi:hypothetical protein
MNKTLNTTLIVLAVLILAGGVFFAGTVYARSNAFSPGWMMGAYSESNGSIYGPGMMGGNGGMMGMMSGNGGMMNMMGNYGGNNNDAYGPGGMMGGYGYNNANLTLLTVDQAKTAAEKYLANIDNSDLQIAEVMIFDNSAYVVVKEASTGNGAFELLVDPTSQIAYPEHGPNMMWNLKYGGINHQYMMGNGGMMGTMGGNGAMTLAPGASAGVNMMGGYGWDTTTPADVSAEMTVTPEGAIEYAQEYLDTNISGTTAATDPIKFYGYYTLDFEKDGKVAGMLSINGYSGQVFLHTWHGTFIEESEIQ